MPVECSQLIEIVPYNLQWPVLFEMEEQHLKSIFDEDGIVMHHIGSTSVAGLAAKPIIDILGVVPNLNCVDSVVHTLEQLGYTYKGEFGIAGRRYFRKRNSGQDYNLHIFQLGALQIEQHILFRDYLRTHEQDRLAYAKLKQELAQQYPYDIDAYCKGKDAFIKNIIYKASNI